MLGSLLRWIRGWGSGVGCYDCMSSGGVGGWGVVYALHCGGARRCMHVSMCVVYSSSHYDGVGALLAIEREGGADFCGDSYTKYVGIGFLMNYIASL